MSDTESLLDTVKDEYTSPPRCSPSDETKLCRTEAGRDIGFGCGNNQQLVALMSTVLDMSRQEERKSSGTDAIGVSIVMVQTMEVHYKEGLAKSVISLS